MNEQEQEALQKALERTGKQLIESVEKLNTAMAKATAQFRETFEAAAKSLPGWTADADGWKYQPNPAEIKTREEAFASFDKRRKKGKKTWRF